MIWLVCLLFFNKKNIFLLYTCKRKEIEIKYKEKKIKKWYGNVIRKGEREIKKM